MLDVNQNLNDIRTFKKDSSNRFIQLLRQSVQKSGQKVLYFSVAWSLVYTSQAYAEEKSNNVFLNRTQIIQAAFDENLYISDNLARRNLIRATQTISDICQSLIGPNKDEELACQWPTVVNNIIDKFDLLSKKVKNTTLDRSARLSSKPLSVSEAFQSGINPQIFDIVHSFHYLQLTQSLSNITKSLRISMKSPIWQLNSALKPMLLKFDSVEEMAILFQAWIQSEEPLGFLLKINSLDSKYISLLESSSACLINNNDDLKFKIIDKSNFISSHRLVFKEIDLTHSNWGAILPGVLMESIDSSIIDENTIQNTIQHILNTDLSFIGSEIDPCRALAWTLSVTGVHIDKIKYDRLVCENAKLNHEPLKLDLPIGTSIFQKSIMLSEIRRERGSDFNSTIEARRAASLFRSLEQIQNLNGKCGDEDRIIFSPLIKYLRTYINFKKLEE